MKPDNGQKALSFRVVAKDSGGGTRARAVLTNVAP